MDENLGQGKPTAGGKVRGVNQSCETIISLASSPFLCCIKVLTVFPLCETEKKKNPAPRGGCSEIRGETEKEKKKKK